VLVSPARAAVETTHPALEILKKACVDCHGPSKQRANLRLDTPQGLKEGGDSGPVFVAGKPDESRLVHSVLGSNGVERMPPKGPPLKAEEVASIRDWIEKGAPFPRSGDDLAQKPKGKDHWAFQPVRKPEVPSVNQPAWNKNPIDRFLLARLSQEGITPSPRADDLTLFRRVSLDLIGLPPDPREIQELKNQHGDQAYAVFVEKLLASPHYGERWSRYWLDQARYADSNGYSIDSPRSIWPWRDWVIKAINADMPFDQFTIQQLAGDLLPGAGLAEKTATGFHRNTQINEEGGVDKEQFRIESIFDRVNTTGSVWLGLTLQCSQCHNHKYDPLTQKEYYKIFAFFNNQEEPNLTLVPGIPAKDKKSKPEKEAITTMVLAERTKPRETKVLLGGDFTRPGQPVEPGTPSVLPTLKDEQNDGLNRLDLARWLVSPDNPLTARVTVNRIWGQFFGLPLVETENDFGTQGTPPSHPELLDWLAAEFMEQGWSWKKLHRTIVLSEAYRQSSHHRADLEIKDPRNKLLARQKRNRLEAEFVRDCALTASGLLSRKVGGPSVFPPQPEGVDQFTQVKRPWKVSEGEDRYRRGLYTHFWRAAPHPALTVFDAPDAGTACTRRTRSNTPLQSLTLLNDQAFMECAQGLALRVLRESSADPIGRMFELCLLRSPQPEEKARLESFFQKQKSAPLSTDQTKKLLNEGGPPGKELAQLNQVEEKERAALVMTARLIMNLDEFITRE